MSARNNLQPHKSKRLVVIDAARGLAIAGVVLYHFVWDLAFLRLTGDGLAAHSAWIVFGRSLAGSFLFLAGFSLVLANTSGIVWQTYIRRILLIVIAAAAITGVTWFTFNQYFVFFGILHAIALASLLGSLFLQLPAIAIAISSLAVMILPQIVDAAAFDTRWLAWIGFSQNPPPSNDLVPVFPWFGVFLLGMACARGISPEDLRRWFAVERSNPILNGASWLGRHSLSIYLLHQPVMLAILYPLA